MCTKTMMAVCVFYLAFSADIYAGNTNDLSGKLKQPRENSSDGEKPTLQEQNTPSATPGPAPASAPGSNELHRGELREIQQHLKQLGYYTGALDGIFGPNTHAAIEEYQQLNGFQPNGQPSRKLLGYLKKPGSLPKPSAGGAEVTNAEKHDSSGTHRSASGPGPDGNSKPQAKPDCPSGEICGAFGIPLVAKFSPDMVAQIISRNESYRKGKFKLEVVPHVLNQNFSEYIVITTSSGFVQSIQAWNEESSRRQCREKVAAIKKALAGKYTKIKFRDRGIAVDCSGAKIFLIYLAQIEVERLEKEAALQRAKSKSKSLDSSGL